MEQLEGSLRMRQAVRVAESVTKGEYTIATKLRVTVCDALQRLPAQELLLEARVRVMSR